MSLEYFYLLMSQDDLFKNQVIEEILRERSSSYILQGKPNDFWILVSPKFIEKEEIQQQIKQTNFYKQREKLFKNKENTYEFYATLISLDKEFITWLSLRLGYFETLNKQEKKIATIKSSLENQFENQLENKEQEYTSNGIMGVISSVPETENMIFRYDRFLLQASVSIKKYMTILNVFEKTNFNNFK
jgi:hypothetical protein